MRKLSANVGLASRTASAYTPSRCPVRSVPGGSRSHAPRSSRAFRGPAQQPAFSGRDENVQGDHGIPVGPRPGFSRRRGESHPLPCEASGQWEDAGTLLVLLDESPHVNEVDTVVDERLPQRSARAALPRGSRGRCCSRMDGRSTCGHLGRRVDVDGGWSAALPPEDDAHGMSTVEEVGASGRIQAFLRPWSFHDLSSGLSRGGTLGRALGGATWRELAKPASVLTGEGVQSGGRRQGIRRKEPDRPVAHRAGEPTCWPL